MRYPSPHREMSACIDPLEEENDVLLCLSSSAMPRYRQDILRALSMPAGARLQFRYTLSLLASGVRDRVKDNGLVGQDACLAYIETSDKSKEPEIVPTRAGKVVRSEVQGDFCVLEFALQGYAYAGDLGAFNRQLRTQDGNLPHWKGNDLIGHFCSEVKADTTLPLKLDAGKAQWQEICRALSKFPAFGGERVFYLVEGVKTLSDSAQVMCDDGIYQFESGGLYEIRLVHFSPIRLAFPARPQNKDMDWLVIDSDEKALTIVGTNTAAVDSDYDRKSFRVRAATTSVPLDARLSFSRRGPNTSKEEATWDFDLQAQVQRQTGRLIRVGLLIGLPVALQGLVLTLSNDKITDKFWVSVAVVLTGFTTGLLATFFGPRK